MSCTAIGMYELAKDRAFRCRLLAIRAATSKKQQLAIRLIARAQDYDERADNWRQAIPEWQWESRFR